MRCFGAWISSSCSQRRSRPTRSSRVFHVEHCGDGGSRVQAHPVFRRIARRLGRPSSPEGTKLEDEVSKNPGATSCDSLPAGSSGPPNQNERPAGFNKAETVPHSESSALTARKLMRSTRSARSALACSTSNLAFATSTSLSLRVRLTSLRNAHLRAFDSTSTSRKPGAPIFKGKAGEPPPDPRSTSS